MKTNKYTSLRGSCLAGLQICPYVCTALSTKEVFLLLVGNTAPSRVEDWKGKCYLL